MQRNSARRLAGKCLISAGIVWLAYAEAVWIAAPVALASEAPYRHLGSREVFSRGDAFQLSFGLAREFRDANPHPLLAGVLLVGGFFLLRPHASVGATDGARPSTGTNAAFSPPRISP